MDTKTTNPLSRYFGEMDKKPARNATLKGIFDQIQAPKSDWAYQKLVDENVILAKSEEPKADRQ